LHLLVYRLNKILISDNLFVWKNIDFTLKSVK